METPKIKKDRKKPYCVYVPETFDPEVALPSELQQHAELARYFLHRIIWGQIMKRRTLDNYVPLKFDYLREVIPDRIVLPLKTALIAANVIECDGHYIEGHKSFGYRLCPTYRDSRIVRVRIEDPVTAEKLRANQRAKYKKVRLDVHCWLRSQFKKLDVDLPLAMSLLLRHRNFELVKIPVDQIANKESEFSVCRYGRVHSSLTRSPSQIRPALQVSGERLVNLDIASSQPLFLSLLIINYRARGNKQCWKVGFQKTSTNQYRDIDKLIEETVSCFSLIHENNTTPVSLLSITTRTASGTEEKHPTEQDVTTNTVLPRDISVNRHFLTQDERVFVSLCEAGQLYGYLMEQMEVPVKRWIKDQLFEVIYGSNRLRSALKDLFEDIFPAVADVVRAHKRKDHAYLPRLLQNIEANFVINTVCRRIMVEMPEAPAFTIHDSILTTRPFVPPIREIMVEEFARLGLKPTLHEKDYGDSR